LGIYFYIKPEGWEDVMNVNNEFKFRVTAFIRTKDQTVRTPAEPIIAQFSETLNGQIVKLFNEIKQLAKRKYGDKFQYITCLRVTFVENFGYNVKAFLNLEREYICKKIKVKEGCQNYAFDKFFEHLTELGKTIHGEQFDGIFNLKFFCLDKENLVVNFY
jgi:hypothetical protein